jgi:hypothetical protein
MAAASVGADFSSHAMPSKGGERSKPTIIRLRVRPAGLARDEETLA